MNSEGRKGWGGGTYRRARDGAAVVDQPGYEFADKETEAKNVGSRRIGCRFAETLGCCTVGVARDGGGVHVASTNRHEATRNKELPFNSNPSGLHDWLS